jgi:methionyl-tRNA formyltransferase
VSIVYFGTGEFAVPSLMALAEHISLVVTQPDRESGRGMRQNPSPVKKKAVELGLRISTPERARNPEFLSEVAAESPDFLLVASYGQILPTGLLDTGRNGGINLHGSLLPKYRGAAPIQRAILEGESVTGVTLMQMDKGMDTGDVIDRADTPIGADETYGELQERLATMAAAMAVKWFHRLRVGEYPRAKQPEQGFSIAHKVAKEEAELRFDMTAEEAYRRFRAFSPSPGPFLMTRAGRLRIGIARLGKGDAEAGTVLYPNLVAFKQGCIELVEVQPEGKKRMTGRDFFNGARLRTGDSLVK